MSRGAVRLICHAGPKGHDRTAGIRLGYDCAPLSVDQGRTGQVVEVPGIEPGSFAALSGLLRAQLAVPLLGPTDHASESV